MNRQEIGAVVLEVLSAIAPEAEIGQLLPDRPLRRHIDLDSIDWLDVLLGLNRRLGVDIPEADCTHLTTLDDVVDDLARRLNTDRPW